MKKRLALLTMLTAFILALSLCLSSCGILARIAERREEANTEDTDKDSDLPQNSGSFEDIEGADDIVQSGNGEQNTVGGSGNSDNNTNNNNTTVIIGGGSGDVSQAAALGLRSSVGVVAGFGSLGASGGSGVIYKLDASEGSAFIITNYHVVYYNGSISSDISIYLYGMQSSDNAISATYVGGSANYDIAVLRVENSSILKSSAANRTVTAVNVANSDNVVVGTAVIAIGTPGVDDSAGASSIAATSGIVSVESEYITMSSINGVGSVDFRVVRIDAAVNSGNSGGGLFNAKGELVGIVNAKITETDVENIAYAIPSNVVKAVCENIIYYCYGKDCKCVVRALMGVTVTATRLYSEYDETTGYIRPCEDISVYEVSSGSLADGKLCAGDVIKSVKIGDIEVQVKRMHHLIDTMLYARLGDEVITTVVRNGQEMEIKIVITEAALTES